LYGKNITYVRFQVLIAASMKITAFWDITPCSLVECALLKGTKACREMGVHIDETFLFILNFADEQVLNA
jgi:hypothetical protein